MLSFVVDYRVKPLTEVHFSVSYKNVLLSTL